MFLLLVGLLIVAPLLELYVIIQVAHSIGGWNTIGLLLLMGLAGGWLLRQQGLSAMRRASSSLQAGRSPDKPLVDGLLVLVAGILMLVPGFVSDVMALFLLLPPTRAIVRAPILKRLKAAGPGAFSGAGSGNRFVGTFWVGGSDVFDVSGRDRSSDDGRRLDP